MLVQVRTHTFAVPFFNLDELRDALVDRHETRGLKDFFVEDHVLLTLLPHLDVKEKQCVELHLHVCCNLGVEAVRAPLLQKSTAVPPDPPGGGGRRRGTGNPWSDGIPSPPRYSGHAGGCCKQRTPAAKSGRSRGAVGTHYGSGKGEGVCRGKWGRDGETERRGAKRTSVKKTMLTVRPKL